MVNPTPVPTATAAAPQTQSQKQKTNLAVPLAGDSGPGSALKKGTSKSFTSLNELPVSSHKQ